MNSMLQEQRIWSHGWSIIWDVKCLGIWIDMQLLMWCYCIQEACLQHVAFQLMLFNKLGHNDDVWLTIDLVMICVCGQ